MSKIAADKLANKQRDGQTGRQRETDRWTDE